LANELYEIVGILDRSLRREKVLRLISRSNVPLSSRIIANETSISQTNVIKILNELQAKEAIREVTNVKRNRMYVITDKGKDALSMIEQIRKV